MANFGRVESLPEEYRDRNLYKWNPDTTLMRTNVEENRQIGERLANAANAATGPVAFLFPMKGVSMLDSEGNESWDPEADAACFDTIKANVRAGVPIIEVEHNINDPEFSGRVAEELLGMLQ
jgi:uncharacterized protein (UPF0261 family)